MINQNIDRSITISFEYNIYIVYDKNYLFKHICIPNCPNDIIYNKLLEH